MQICRVHAEWYKSGGELRTTEIFILFQIGRYPHQSAALSDSQFDVLPSFHRIPEARWGVLSNTS